MRRESCTRAVGSAPCRPPACVLAHSPRELPSLVPALGQLSVWTPRRGYSNSSTLDDMQYVSERRPASGHARLNPCAREMQSMQGVQTRIPGYAPTFAGFGPRSRPAGARAAGRSGTPPRAPRRRTVARRRESAARLTPDPGPTGSDPVGYGSVRRGPRTVPRGGRRSVTVFTFALPRA